MIDKIPSWLKAEYWYHVFVLLGSAGVLVSLMIETKGITNSQALLLSLGVLFIGLGEWINHPLQTGLMRSSVYAPGGGIVKGHPRNSNLLGWLFDFLGFSLIGTGLYKIILG